MKLAHPFIQLPYRFDVAYQPDLLPVLVPERENLPVVMSPGQMHRIIDDLAAELPDGGLKSFGHPIGASGLRMLYECRLQLPGQAPEDRQIRSVTEMGKKLGMTHNLGGAPGECVSFVSIVGSELG